MEKLPQNITVRLVTCFGIQLIIEHDGVVVANADLPGDTHDDFVTILDAIITPLGYVCDYDGIYHDTALLVMSFNKTHE